MISVIVPIYNTGLPLRRCIDSILSQTYSPLEIILVDDGSTDDVTLSICQDYQRSHTNIILIHQENGGPSKARNTGIERSKGKYIAFVDSDDFIDSNAYSDLFNTAEKYNVPLVLGAMSVDGAKQVYNSSELKDGKYDRETIMSKFLRGNWHSACTNLYSSDLIRGVRFPLNEINEDYIFNFEVILKCDNIGVFNNPFYHYVKGGDSRTSAPASLKHLDWLKHTEYVENRILSIYGDRLADEAKFQQLFANIVLSNKCILNISRGILKEPSVIYGITTSNLSRLRHSIFRNKFLSKRFRLFGIALSTTPQLYKAITIIIIRMKRWIS